MLEKCCLTLAVPALNIRQLFLLSLSCWRLLTLLAFLRPPPLHSGSTMVIKVFIASSSGSKAVRKILCRNNSPILLYMIKKQQQEVLDYLQANKIEFERCDIAVNYESKMFMRENVPENCRPISGNPLPPQIFNDDHYCGNFESFFDARENNAVYAFLGLTPPPGSKEAEALAKQAS
ncbi:adapter SH3BGRL-like isoform X2 [Scyliorhinus torazame]|uniref:adapter SH3BGRL-like isoform X2 n=1 Tax=Scyliorhinus torazame TaxID=75743 RepID=UPI003B5BBA0A